MDNTKLQELANIIKELNKSNYATIIFVKNSNTSSAQRYTIKHKNHHIFFEIHDDMDLNNIHDVIELVRKHIKNCESRNYDKLLLNFNTLKNLVEDDS